MNIILIGMRGAGKSKVSRRLSLLSKRDVLSTDLLIQYDNGGRSIPTLLAEHNGDWRAFRDMEYQVVQKVTALDNMIVDCGGGIVVDVDETGQEVYSQRKIDLLRQTGTIVWLKGDIARLAAKVKGDANRPSLSQIHSAEEMMQRRLPFYEQAADMIVDIEQHTRKQVAEILHEKFS